ncbi:hypothetical protein ED312_03245 [Sinomicrobium pectinilyticum]|uniref:Uncharacterized protein n=1 Tax=Sinomicrobium pectinilyticum TaxID=1084421 RepID=A0A3N0EYV1_SINP1|nr:hypothetical protein ED312_03245 [Sinomicrobium pectinilyticum]
MINKYFLSVYDRVFSAKEGEEENTVYVWRSCKNESRSEIIRTGTYNKNLKTPHFVVSSGRG